MFEEEEEENAGSNFWHRNGSGRGYDADRAAVVLNNAVATSFHVKPCHHLPLWEVHHEEDVSRAVLSSCIPLEAYLRLESSNFGAREATTRLEFANDMLIFVEDELKRTSGNPNASFTKYLKETNLDSVCPRIAAWCHDEEIISNKGILDDYFANMAHINSILTLCNQIEADVEHHKYKHLAHTLALLYRAVCHSNRPLEAYKLAIEQKFTKLKSVTRIKEDGQYEGMPHKLETWLLAMLKQLRHSLEKDIDTLVPNTQEIVQWLDKSGVEDAGLKPLHGINRPRKYQSLSQILPSTLHKASAPSASSQRRRKKKMKDSIVGIDLNASVSRIDF
eukprot:m.66052 g.66052  ORF g.66052 m.66052 type:complete len:334 (+) comp8177_c1_seq2:70-1071(+)